jgi:putative molybdopterin biosynthesis protein
MMSGFPADNAFLASSHVGSLAGLMALKRGECHIAPIHLLDEESGDYNISWLKNTFPNKNSCLIKGLGRVQGLISRKDNPLGIKSIADLLRCRFINRQRGAGTRIFLDHLLKKEGLDFNNINGYTREAATHMAAAAAVHGGSSDVGMGIAAAAKALDLDFIPLGEEEYDFAVFSDSLELEGMKMFIDILKSPGFHKQLEEFNQPFNAYTWSQAGELVYI